MPVDEDDLRAAVEAVAAAPGLAMDEDDLVEDVFLLSLSFLGREELQSAVAATVRAMEQLAQGTVGSSRLEYGLDDWRSYPYQRSVAQCARTTCRIVFREIDGGVAVKGFGHRHIPKDLYTRMSATRAFRGNKPTEPDTP